MFILVVNAGSSSLKYQLFDMEKEQVLAKGLCERITLDGKITHTRLADGKKFVAEIAMPSHNEATRAMIDAILDADHGVLTDMGQISAIGHRVVQGGPWLTKPTLVTDEAIEALERCVDLAPLHTIPHLQGIKGCKSVMPNTPMVLVIDTSFHATIPEYASTFPIDINVARKHHIKRYGAHGTSHRYVAQECAKYLNKPVEETKIVTCHLGNGSSISAVKGGKVVDTSMGFTPLDGFIMGTRSGGVDPSALTYIANKENLTPDQLSYICNKKSGLLGISGVSSDNRDVSAAAAEGNHRAALANEIQRYQIAKFVGSYIAAMNGTDAIVFTAGIGENDPVLRSAVCKHFEYMGVKIDEEKNKLRGEEIEISTPDSSVKVYVIPTNEELAIAKDTLAIVTKLKK